MSSHVQSYHPETISFIEPCPQFGCFSVYEAFDSSSEKVICRLDILFSVFFNVFYMYGVLLKTVAIKIINPIGYKLATKGILQRCIIISKVVGSVVNINKRNIAYFVFPFCELDFN